MLFVREVLHKFRHGIDAKGKDIFVEVKFTGVMTRSFFRPIEHVNGLAAMILDAAHKVRAVLTATDSMIFFNVAVDAKPLDDFIDFFAHVRRRIA